MHVIISPAIKSPLEKIKWLRPPLLSLTHFSQTQRERERELKLHDARAITIKWARAITIKLPSHSRSYMLPGKLQDSLSDGVSMASRLMSRSVSSGEGDRAAVENSSDLTLRSKESGLSSVRLSVGATRRFFLMGFPDNARLLGGSGPQPIRQAQSHALYVCVLVHSSYKSCALQPRLVHLRLYTFSLLSQSFYFW